MRSRIVKNDKINRKYKNSVTQNYNNNGNNCKESHKKDKDDN